jgi:hypothetical protein
MARQAEVAPVCRRGNANDADNAASVDPAKPCRPDIERYLMAHSSNIHALYGDWLVPDLKAAIKCIPDPLDREATPLAAAAE